MSAGNSIPALWLPLVIPAGGEAVAFQRQGAPTTTLYAPVPGGTYATPAAFCAAVVAAYAGQGITVAVTLEPTGRTRISDVAGQRLVPALSGPALLAALGWDVGDAPGDFAAAVVSPRASAVYWTPGVQVAFDSFDIPQIEAALTVTLDGHHQRLIHGRSVRREVEFTHVPGWKVIVDIEGSENAGEAFSRYWEAALGGFFWTPDRAQPGSGAAYYLAKPDKEWAPKRMFPAPALYSFKLTFGKKVEG